MRKRLKYFDYMKCDKEFDYFALFLAESKIRSPSHSKNWKREQSYLKVKLFHQTSSYSRIVQNIYCGCGNTMIHRIISGDIEQNPLLEELLHIKGNVGFKFMRPKFVEVCLKIKPVLLLVKVLLLHCMLSFLHKIPD